jgi:hypothetical protein
MSDAISSAQAIEPAPPTSDPIGANDLRSRRAFCAASIGAAAVALTGCAGNDRSRRPLPSGEFGGAATLPSPSIEPSRVPSVPAAPSPFPGVISRTAWARGEPEPTLMNPMLPVRYVTVHHDGLDRLETGTARPTMADRIELYRVGHRGKGWGDIGYHFVIDRAGAVWQGRDLRWQGAHVKDRNEGNVGILVMGNFEIQEPTTAQLRSLRDHLRAVCAYYSVPWTRVFSHREWPGAQTLCPGRNLQRAFVSIRAGERV